MTASNNYGLIIRQLRRLQGLNVHDAAKKISRSVGWLSEVERGLPRARLTDDEFKRIIEILDGNKHKAMFKTWIAKHANQSRVDKTYDGAILKYIRIKNGLSLKDAGQLLGLSYNYVSELETGRRPLSLLMRHKFMQAYGYQPNSFKNLHSDPVKSKAVPSKFKLTILLRRLTSEQVDLLFQTLTEQTTGAQW